MKAIINAVYILSDNNSSLFTLLIRLFDQRETKSISSFFRHCAFLLIMNSEPLQKVFCILSNFIFEFQLIDYFIMPLMRLLSVNSLSIDYALIFQTPQYSL